MEEAQDDSLCAYGLDGMTEKMVAGEIDCVTVHGLHGDRRHSWKAQDSQETNMISEIAGENARILKFGFDALQMEDGVYCANGIAREATKLLDQLTEARKGLSPSTFRTIVFVAHDIGGSIVQQALYQAGLAPNQNDILSCTKLLVLFGCPQRIHSLQDMEDSMTRLVFSGSKLPSNDILYSIKCLAKSVMESIEASVESKILLRANIVTIFSENKNPARIFDEYMMTTDLGCETRIAIDEEHARLISLSRVSDKWSSLRHKISDVKRSFNSCDPSDAEASEQMVLKHAYQDFLVSLSPTLESYTTPDYRCGGLQWLTAHEKFMKWQKNPHSDILIIERPEAESGRVAELIYRTISEKSERLPIKTFFRFDRHDDRRNSLRAFAARVVAGWVTSNVFLDSIWILELTRFIEQRGFTNWDLLSLLIKMRTFDAWEETIFMLDNAEQCHDLAPMFWSHMAYLSETRDHPWKFILLTDSRDHLVDDWVMSWPCINTCTDAEGPMESHSVAEMNLDSATGRAADTKSNLDLLIPTPDIDPSTIMENILRGLSVEKQKFVERTIRWITFAFRPLSIKELASALTFEEKFESTGLIGTGNSTPSTPSSLIKDLGQLLQGLFVINHEIRFLNPRLQDVFREQNNFWHKDEPHEQIAKICLKYLATSDCQESFNRLCATRHGPLSVPLFTPQDSLASYAAEYWPRHANLAIGSEDIPACIDEFFQDGGALRAWEEARWFMSEPMTRTTQCYKSVLPLLSSTGLERVPIPPSSDHVDNRHALIEATRNGNHETVKLLLNSVEVDSQAAQATLLAASTFANEEFQIDLVLRFSSLEQLTWPQLLILRASWLGQYRLAELLLDRDIDLAIDHETFLQQGPLHLAARNGHLEVAELIIGHDPSLVHQRADELSPLDFAARFGHPSIVKLLLDCGAEKHAWTSKSNRPLSSACFDGKHAAARVLLENGADPNLPDPKGLWPPLTVAAGEGYLRCVDLLLEYEAIVDTETAGGTPLYQAVSNKNTDVCRMLLAHGADASYSGASGPVLAVAAGKNSIEMVKLLVEYGADVNFRIKEEDFTALHHAIADSASMEIIEFLLEKGADPNLRTPEEAPLYHAVFRRNVELIRLLIEQGANVNILAGKSNWTPLQAAYKDPIITKMLLDSGAEINAMAEDTGHSALMLAAMFNEPEVVEILLQNNADVNLRGVSSQHPYRYDCTALSAAVSHGHVQVARMLLEAGANVNYHDKYYSVLRDAAATSEDMLRTIMEFRPDLTVETEPGRSALHWQTLLSNVKILVHGGIEIDHVDDSGATPLCHAAAHGNPDVVQFLLKKGASIKTSSKRGSVLHWACRYGSLETVKLLVEAGADVHRVHPEVGSVLYVACEQPLHSSSEFWEESDRKGRSVIQYLLEECEKKPNINRTGGPFGYPLSAACMICSSTTVDFLLQHGAKIDVHDEFGRYPIHLAARADKENFELLRGKGADLYCLDKSRRNILHFAVQSGRADLTKSVLKATDGLLNVTDAHGWTPLHFAARGFVPFRSPLNAGWNAEVIKLLVEEGADPWAESHGDGQDWSPLRTARYHGAPQEILKILRPREKDTQDGKHWDESRHQSRKAARTRAYCDCCLFDILGFRYKCLDCDDFDLCYMCIRDAGIVHAGHPFTEMGPEFEQDNSESSDHAESEEESDNDGEYDESEDTDAESERGSAGDGNPRGEDGAAEENHE
ncbi:ankyrin repeat-containing domain protein [Phyllosticta capitalensis]